MEVFNVFVIVIAGLMVGCEFGVAAFVHPTLNELPDAAHIPAAAKLARVLGRYMPFWYGLVLLLTAAEVFIYWQQSGGLSVWFITSAILWALAIAFSITMLVPINNRIASWEKVTPPSDWKTSRNRWDLLHRWRVALLTPAFVFLIVGGR